MELAIPTDCQNWHLSDFHYSVSGNCSPCVKGLLQRSSVRSATLKWRCTEPCCVQTHLTRASTNTRDFGTASPQTACTKADVPWMLDCRGSKFRGGKNWNLNQWFLNSELCPPLLCRLTVWLDLLSFLLILFYWQILNISKWHNTTNFGYKKTHSCFTKSFPFQSPVAMYFGSPFFRIFCKQLKILHCWCTWFACRLRKIRLK